MTRYERIHAARMLIRNSNGITRRAVMVATGVSYDEVCELFKLAGRDRTPGYDADIARQAEQALASEAGQ